MQGKCEVIHLASPVSRFAALLKHQGQALSKNKKAPLGSVFVEMLGLGAGEQRGCSYAAHTLLRPARGSACCFSQGFGI